MRVLVTGSAGLIGTAVVDALESAGHEVVGLDRRRPADDSNGRRIVCDILDRDRVVSILPQIGPDAVIHLAARIDIDEQRNLRGYAANIDGVANVLQAIRSAGTVRRGIITSSHMVCEPGYTPKDDQDYKPHTLYGRSKVETERLTRHAHIPGLVWTLVRPTTVWGPGMSAHYQRFVRMIARGRYFHVGNRPLLKSFGYVKNVAHQYRKLLEAPESAVRSKTLYVADYEPLSLRDWGNAFQREIGSRVIPTVPEGAARFLATFGDALNSIGLSRFPFNSFRLKNVLTEYRFDLSETEKICGSLPCDMLQGVSETVTWLRRIGVLQAGAV